MDDLSTPEPHSGGHHVSGEPAPPAAPAGPVRLVVALALLLAVVAILAWAWSNQPPSGTGEAGVHPVAVIAPDGSTFWSGTVVLGNGSTPLAALEEAARLGGFSLDIRSGPYVVGVGPYSESSTLGWTYWVRHPEGGGPTAGYTDEQGFFCPDLAADVWLLDAHDEVQWRWAVPGGQC
jgi:hypothetical protein